MIQAVGQLEFYTKFFVLARALKATFAMYFLSIDEFLYVHIQHICSKTSYMECESKKRKFLTSNKVVVAS